jgi:hypothetical protein
VSGAVLVERNKYKAARRSVAPPGPTKALYGPSERKMHEEGTIEFQNDGDKAVLFDTNHNTIVKIPVFYRTQCQAVTAVARIADRILAGNAVLVGRFWVQVTEE